MRLMTRVTRQPTGVLLSFDLRKSRGLCNVRLVTPHAQHCSIEFLRLHTCRIVHMRCQWSVASFTTDPDMLAGVLLLSDIGMAVLTRLAARICDWTRSNIRDCSSPKMAVFAESLMDENAAHTDKENQPKRKHDRQTK